MSRGPFVEARGRVAGMGVSAVGVVVSEVMSPNWRLSPVAGVGDSTFYSRPRSGVPLGRFVCWEIHCVVVVVVGEREQTPGDWTSRLSCSTWQVDRQVDRCQQLVVLGLHLPPETPEQNKHGIHIGMSWAYLPSKVCSHFPSRQLLSRPFPRLCPKFIQHCDVILRVPVGNHLRLLVTDH